MLRSWAKRIENSGRQSNVPGIWGLTLPRKNLGTRQQLNNHKPPLAFHTLLHPRSRSHTPLLCHQEYYQSSALREVRQVAKMSGMSTTRSSAFRFVLTLLSTVVGVDFGTLNTVIAVARNRGVDVVCIVYPVF